MTRKNLYVAGLSLAVFMLGVGVGLFASGTTGATSTLGQDSHAGSKAAAFADMQQQSADDLLKLRVRDLEEEVAGQKKD